MLLPDHPQEPVSANSGEIDEMDRKIILQLAEDGRRSYRQIARTLGVSEGTVRFRANQMISGGHIRIAAVGNAMHFGVQVIAITLLKITPSEINAAAAKLTEYDNVRFVGLSFGSADIIIQTLHTSQKDLHHFLTEVLPSKISGLNGLETFQLAEVAKSTWDWEAWFNLASNSKQQHS